MRIQRGGQGVRTPPGKSQVIWVSIGDKQLPPPLEKVGPPPPPWKMLEPLWNFEKVIVFFEINYLTSVENKRGLKKKKKKKNIREGFFYPIDLDPPPPTPDESSWIPA